MVRDRHTPDGNGNGTGIFLVRPNGSGGHWFSNGRGHGPSWSPDGKKLLFVRGYNAADLWIADKRGRQETKLSSFRYDFLGGADWSPDGSKIVVTGSSGIYVFSLNGVRLERGTGISRGYGYGSAWSPTAPQIAFVRARRRFTIDQLVVVEADGSGLHVITTGRSFSGPSWSPDGSELAFVRRGRKVDELVVVGASGRGLHVAATGRWSSGPERSPDGNEFALIRCTARGSWLSLMDVNGSGLRNVVQLTKRRCVGGSVTWSPDGKLLAFVLGGGYGASLHVVGADGKNQRTILRHVDGCCPLSWQPLKM